MNKISFIKYKGKNELIEQFPSETINRFNKRQLFIKLLEEDNFNWKEAHKLSKVWYNIIYNKTKYAFELYNVVMKFTKILEKK